MIVWPACSRSCWAASTAGSRLTCAMTACTPAGPTAVHVRGGELACGDQHAAFGLTGLRVLMNNDGHRVGRHATVADNGIGDVFDECALLAEAAALGQLDDHFRHTRQRTLCAQHM